VGAAYLCYLGVRIIRARGEGGQVENLEDKRLATIFRQGFVTNVLNLKVCLFFIAFLPQFADPSRGLVGAQIVLLGIIFNTSGTVVNLSVALLSGRLGAWLVS
jgi:threonine/homoserine/homoserine lactone efflux protein